MLVGLGALIWCAGCASVGNVSRENIELKARVAALETQVADLKAENQKLKPATVVSIDGLKLEPPTVGELRFTPVPVFGGRADRWGAVGTTTHLVWAGSNEVGFFTAVGSPKIGRGTITVQQAPGAHPYPAGGLLWDDRNGASEMIRGTIQLKNSASTTNTTTTKTTTTTTTPASRP
jgi:hypothetical protein